MFKEVRYILDRDGHFVGVLESKDGGLVLAHRRFEDKNEPDLDDVALTKIEAVQFLADLKKVLNINSIQTGIEVKLSSNIKKEIQIYPRNLNFIGLGIDEARELVKQLEEKI